MQTAQGTLPPRAAAAPLSTGPRVGARRRSTSGRLAQLRDACGLQGVRHQPLALGLSEPLG
eukprot:8258739-Alexandrium_andersonii.AAC.1